MLLFLKAVYLYKPGNELLTRVIYKPGAKPTSSEQHLKRNTALKTEKKMNQKPYNKCLINLVCSVCTGKYFFAQTSPHRSSVCMKPQANTFPYRPASHSVNKPLFFILAGLFVNVLQRLYFQKC